ncbi:hypothetical protein CI109_106186 [Kwoniella shandongensis]|uniref:Uncharacterized protein n=1 Tax=Kwoniella shandongensis TaxID=1734106 RepID=A0A5M6BZY2_9TREE|nr:uncharacterized protein CI109_003791 [Kwoniella shandongensis]KAA5527820.1 hypothetical protein CI109_003791 [Kwoniella shandongensis]
MRSTVHKPKGNHAATVRKGSNFTTASVPSPAPVKSSTSPVQTRDNEDRIHTAEEPTSACVAPPSGPRLKEDEQLKVEIAAQILTNLHQAVPYALSEAQPAVGITMTNAASQNGNGIEHGNPEEYTWQDAIAYFASRRKCHTPRIFKNKPTRSNSLPAAKVRSMILGRRNTSILNKRTRAKVTGQVNPPPTAVDTASGANGDDSRPPPPARRVRFADLEDVDGSPEWVSELFSPPLSADESLPSGHRTESRYECSFRPL